MLLGVTLGAALLVASSLSGQQVVEAATPSELSTGTYSVSASLSAAVANHGDFGAAVYSSAYITKKSDGSTYITVKFQSTSMTIYGVTTDVFVDVNPGTGNASRGVSDGILGIYQNGTLTTTGVTYTLSSDTAVNSNGESVNYVNSATFPVSDGASSYNLAIYINSNTMGVEFCNSNASATAATYPATLTIDWSSISTSSNGDSSSSVQSASESSSSTSSGTASTGNDGSAAADGSTDAADGTADATTEDLTISTTTVSEEDGLTVYETEDEAETEEDASGNTALVVMMMIGAAAVLGGAGYLIYRKRAVKSKVEK